ncbi:FGGY carbohydrate kinase domain-containing protein isoform X6 [Neoarius graeffei]|uniref:FGGY carbohydrate kinase domain-containing protein isoform X6 n=1 Tax=Neoarius graeffei TaxID=443677 RepID=UPI00298C5156|nr:FGGY carbohydrate kinase domain-containing protein isoform X6 [Neoarius graeffei]
MFIHPCDCSSKDTSVTSERHTTTEFSRTCSTKRQVSSRNAKHIRSISKKNLRTSCWKEAAHFFDLPDFLSWKATGSLVRSLCTVVCKWTYSPLDGWDDSFWATIGLEDLIENNHSKIGERTCYPGSPVGGGLTPEAAADLGLEPGTAVGGSLIDAHAGGLGVIGADVSGHHLPCENQPITSRIALICGTSSCHMAVSRKPLFVPGVWGPYLSAMVPDLWLNEGGQSATGKLIDHVVTGHAAFCQLKERAEKSGLHIYSFLNGYLEEMAKDLKNLDELTAGLHVWPDFHGNRSPLADQSLKGMVIGLSLSQKLDDLALLYLATLQATALGTRHILDALREAGHDITTLFLCGGLSKNPLFVQMHANITGLPIVLPAEKEAVLVGAAVLGACASRDYTCIQLLQEEVHRVPASVRPSERVRSADERPPQEVKVWPGEHTPTVSSVGIEPELLLVLISNPKPFMSEQAACVYILIKMFDHQ